MAITDKFRRDGFSLFRLRSQRPFYSIFRRIAFGNALVIAAGAIGGTLLTRHLASEAVDLWLILFFMVAGTALSISVNAWIIWGGLRPLAALRKLVSRVEAGQTSIDMQRLKNIDPDIEQLADTLDRIVRQLEERNQQLRLLSQRANQAQEEERMRIARCLHDDTGQSLSMLIISLERLENRLPENPGAVQERLRSARKLATSTLEELRKIIFDLRPTILDDLGLVPAIRWYARTRLEGQGVQVQLDFPEEAAPVKTMAMAPQLATTLFRISQEAINNISRHAAAQNVRIRLEAEERQIRLEIVDDGAGFEMQNYREQKPGLEMLGLLGMQERVERAGGRFTLQSAPGQGTRLEVCLPRLESEGETDG